MKMISSIFSGVRDASLTYKETGVTTNKTGEAIHLPTNQCNVLVETQGLGGETALSIKFEESKDGVDFNEIGTFPILDSRHGVLFAKFEPYVRYSLIVGGTEPNIDITIRF